MDKYKIVGKLRQLFFGSMAVIMSAGGVVATNMANAFAADQSLDNNVGVAARKLQYDDTESYVSKNVNKKVVTSEADKSTKEIKNDLKPDLREIERLDLKNIAQSFKELTNHQIFKNYLSYFISKKEENLNYENLFLKEFVLAMFISCILSYDLS